jgi:hypothetical protein
MKVLLAAVCLCASAALAQGAAPPAQAPAQPQAQPPPQGQMQMPKPAPENKVEWWFVGNWDCKGQQHAGAMGPEGPTESKLEFRNVLASFWLHVRGTAQSGPMKGKEFFAGYAGWDGSIHQRYDFSPGGFTHYTTKGWDGDKMVFDGEGSMMGHKMAVRHTITKKGDNQFATLIESDGKPMVEETCTRSAKK